MVTEMKWRMQLKLTFSLALVAVPINTVFGISVAMLIARNEFRGKVRHHRDFCTQGTIPTVRTSPVTLCF